MKIAILPSNQHLNKYLGLPGVTEEKWAVAVSAWVVRRLKERGAEVGYFHVPGAGSSSVDELDKMIAQAIAWNPDYTISVHSDAVGDAKQTGILMLMLRESDRAYGQALGKAIAKNVGLPYKATWVAGKEMRWINYLRALYNRNRQGCLVEVGEHATVAEAAWNWRYTKEIGLGIADALADHLGLTTAPEEEGDDMTDEDRKLLTEVAGLLKQSRVSDVARSHDMEILKAMIGGESDERISELETQKAEATRQERKRLGL